MLIAKVIGTTVSTVKDEKLYGRKLLILRQTDETGAPSGKPYVAVDTVDAGIGDLVLTAAGSSARQTDITKDTPVDAVIMSIIDSLEVDARDRVSPSDARRFSRFLLFSLSTRIQKRDSHWGNLNFPEHDPGIDREDKT